MIGTHHFIQNKGVFQIFPKFVTYQKVVDAPTYIGGTCIKPLIPEGVLNFIGIKMTEGIDHSGIQQILNAINFHLGVPGSFGSWATFKSPVNITGFLTSSFLR
jgi:hypothetical protein